MAWGLIEKIESHEGLMTARDVMEITGLGRRKVYEMLDNQEIPTVPLGKNTKAKRVDPRTWAYVMRKRNPLMRDADRAR